MKKVETGYTVSVHYTGKYEDGTIFDSSYNEGREPLSAVLGQQQLIPGFEAGLHGMTEGEKKSITVSPEQAYGPYTKELVIEVPTDRLPVGIQVGTQLQTMTPNGPALATVTSITENTAIVDHNHPLAGKTLHFELEVITIEETTDVVEDAEII